MIDSSDTKPATEDAPKPLNMLQAVIPFAITLFLGAVVTGVAGLFVYANTVDPKSRDAQFLAVCLVGMSVSLVAAWFAARRALEVDAASNTGQEFSLLKKYRRASTAVGADAQAGQYSIGENYLRELLGRRGA